jgi:hypothetical protein
MVLGFIMLFEGFSLRVSGLRVSGLRVSGSGSKVYDSWWRVWGV